MAARRNKARKKDKRRRHAETRRNDAAKSATATSENRPQQPARGR